MSGVRVGDRAGHASGPTVTATTSGCVKRTCKFFLGGEKGEQRHNIMGAMYLDNRTKVRQLRVVMEEMGVLPNDLTTRLDSILKRTDNEHAIKDAMQLEEMRASVLQNLEDRAERTRRFLDKLRRWERLLNPQPFTFLKLNKLELTFFALAIVGVIGFSAYYGVEKRIGIDIIVALCCLFAFVYLVVLVVKRYVREARFRRWKKKNRTSSITKQ